MQHGTKQKRMKMFRRQFGMAALVGLLLVLTVDAQNNRNAVTPPNWAIGSFTGQASYGPQMIVTIDRNGNVTSQIAGNTTYGRYVRGDWVEFQGMRFQVLRSGNAIETYDPVSGVRVSFTRNRWNGGPGYGGGDNGGLGQPGVTVYEDRNSSGRSQSYGEGRYLNAGGQLGAIGNDQASSVVVSNGYRVRLCDSEGSSGLGTGQCEDYGPGSYNLRYNDKASFIEVTRDGYGGDYPGGYPTGGGYPGGYPSGGGNEGLGQPGVMVYEDRNSNGRSQSYGVGRYLNAGGQLGAIRNDKASSVVVSNGYRVRLCDSEGSNGLGSGQCEDYGPGSYNLRYDDKASFIEVTRDGYGGNYPGGYPNGGNGTWSDPVDIGDLVGIRSSSGESELRSRGFRNVDSSRRGSTSYTIWWRATSRQCVQVATVGGRYDSVTDIGSHVRCR
jgi:hypothetical protein